MPLPEIGEVIQHGPEAFQIAIAYKVLGPPAGALGERLRNTVDDFRFSNIARILGKASRKVDERGNEDEGQVAPRVVGVVTENGQYCDDEIMAEYFGGVLAASRTPGGRDDRGAMWASQVGQMSVYQVRLHYLAYRAAYELIEVNVIASTDSETLRGTRIFMPWTPFCSAMGFQEFEDPEVLTGHAVSQLARSGLVDARGSWGWWSGTDDFPPEGFKEAGVLITPSYQGIELFLWAHGRGDILSENFLDLPLIFDCGLADPSARLYL